MVPNNFLQKKEAWWSMVVLGDGLELLCILWHRKPAACGRQDGFIEVYQSILGENFMPSVRKLKLGLHWTFQLNNDPKHTSDSTLAWLQKKS